MANVLVQDAVDACRKDCEKALEHGDLEAAQRHEERALRVAELSMRELMSEEPELCTAWTRKVEREMRREQFPAWTHEARYMDRLEQQYKGLRVENGRCPHQGIDLRGIEPDAQGFVRCPGHGLRWCPKTGEMATQGGKSPCKTH